MIQPAHRGGFTLIEMLVVISIIAILMGILVPSVVMIRSYAKVAKAKTNIASISLALDNFHSDWRCYPPHRVEDLSDFAKTFTNGVCEEPATAPAVTITNTKESDEEQRLRYDTSRILVRFLTTLEKGPYLKMDQRELERDGQFSGHVFDCRDSDSATVPAYLYIDPWGKPYIYRNNLDTWSEVESGDCIHNIRGFDLYSTGRDRRTAVDDGVADPCENGQYDDDINNWVKEEKTE